MSHVSKDQARMAFISHSPSQAPTSEKSFKRAKMPGKIKFLLPSLGDIFFLCPFLILSLNSGHNLLNDLGTGFHIRTGQYILGHLAVPQSDVFSYFVPALPWVAHEWFSEVIMALVYHSSGLTGVVLLYSFVIGLIYFLLFKFVHAFANNIIFSSFIVFLAAISSRLHWLARPHIFTLALALVWYAILDAYQHKNKNYLYLLPIIMLLWVNLHGGFVLGFMLLAIYLSGNTAGALFSSHPDTVLHTTKVRPLAYTTILCLLFSLANPRGIHALFFPFETVSQQFLIDHVMEYLSPNFHFSLPFKYLLLLSVGLLALSRVRVNLIELTLLLLFTYMALYSARHIPLFAIVAAPILARQAWLILQRADGNLIELFKTRSQDLTTFDARLKGHAWPVLAVLAVCILANNGVIHFDFNQTSAPVAAVDFLKRENIGGNMFNTDRFGDYVIYAAWPQYKVFIDGRSDMYGTDKVKEYLQVIRIQPGWKDVLSKYDINFCFFDSHSPLSSLMRESDDWRLVYADETANVFVRNVKENRSLIDKYPDVKPAAGRKGEF